MRKLLLVTLLVSMTLVLLGMPEPLLEVWRFEVVGNTYNRQLLAFKSGVLLTIFKHNGDVLSKGQNLKATFGQPCSH